jgi:hypothetical protein
MLVALLGTAACDGADVADEPLQVELGIPDKETRRLFLPLEPAGEIYFFKGLQVEDFVMIAIRVRGEHPKAYVAVSVSDLDTGAEVSQAEASEPDPLECADDGWCTLAPVLLPARELGELSAISGAHLEVHGSVRLEGGARGEATAQGILRPQPP